MSPFQELWTYAHVKRAQKQRRDEAMSIVKLVCSFINPTAAKKVFTEPDVSVSTGFFDDMRAIDPNFDPSNYEADLQALGK